MWPLRSSRQRSGDNGGDSSVRVLANRMIVRSCEALRLYSFPVEILGVVKPHGRLGLVSSEVITDVPLPTYRRGGLPRPFRGVKLLSGDDTAALAVGK